VAVPEELRSLLRTKLPAALAVRDERAAALIELDEVVASAVAALKERGFVSPYLKAFVIARINPLRFQRGTDPTFDETIKRRCSRRRGRSILPRSRPIRWRRSRGLPRTEVARPREPNGSPLGAILTRLS
jgi:hypothetical protein